VVDLGTRFGVLVEQAGTTQVHVFEGEVQAMATAAPLENQPPAAPLLLSMLQAAQFDSAGKMVEWIAPDYEKFGSARLAPGMVSTSDQVRWVPQLPLSLEEGKFSHSGQVCLILERQNVELPTDVQVTFMPPLLGTKSSYNSHWKMLKKGTRVDSYLLHFDSPPGAPLGGNVHFERPILGIIARGNQLVKTDRLLGAAGVSYERTNIEGRGLEGAEIPEEHLDVILFPDANGVGVWLAGQHGTLDEVRVLVESAP